MNVRQRGNRVPGYRAAAFATALLIGLAACDPPPGPPAGPIEVIRCELLLIAADADGCVEDFVGPGELTITFRPDPKEASWEVGVSGLTALTDQCAFRGRYDQTRLSALQGRGETDIVCPLAAEVDRQYHTLAFETHDAAPGTALRVHVVLRRPPA